jgi:hypothetical protein
VNNWRTIPFDLDAPEWAIHQAAQMLLGKHYSSLKGCKMEKVAGFPNTCTFKYNEKTGQIFDFKVREV